MSKVAEFIYDVCLDRFEGLSVSQIAAKYKRLGVTEDMIKEILRQWYDVMIRY